MTQQSNQQDAPILLPDGTRFQHWQDETEYKRAYYVDQQHPGAADDNPGTEEAPFLTIQAAAEVPVDLGALGIGAKLTLCAAMVLGRLELLAIIALLTPGLWRD